MPAFLKIPAETRDSIIAFTGVVVSVCTGIWTYYNYDQKEREAEINAIFEIAATMQEISIEHNKPGEQNEEKIDDLLKSLMITLPHRYNLISEPCFNKESWHRHWNDLNNHLETAWSSDYETVSDKINNSWNKIMEMKNMHVLGKEK